MKNEIFINKNNDGLSGLLKEQGISVYIDHMVNKYHYLDINFNHVSTLDYDVLFASEQFPSGQQYIFKHELPFTASKASTRKILELSIPDSSYNLFYIDILHEFEIDKIDLNNIEYKYFDKTGKVIKEN